MKLQDLISAAAERFEAAGIEEGRATAEALLCFVLNVSRTRVLAFPNEEATSQQEKVFETFVSQKLKGLPLQYITKEQQFMGRIFEVGPSVLIPRPETEEMTHEVIRRAKKMPSKILDMCTGSGCIACSLALRFPSAQVTAVDISEEALNTARKNAQNMSIKNINFIKSDIFKKVEGVFDIIVTNPPYIPTGDLAALSKEVLAEPHLALDGGKDGLKIIKRILKAAPEYLNPGGLLAMEFVIGAEYKILKLLSPDIWQTTEIKKDIFNVNRFLFATRK